MRFPRAGSALGAAATAVSLLAAAPAGAELVELASGHVLKVVSYRLEGSRISFELPSGGELTLPILGVERIVDDEIASGEDPVPEAVVGLGFDAAHEVPATPYGELIYETARRHTVNPALVAAMVQVESGFDPGAVSHKGAAGLMQLMPATARRFGLEVAKLHDPASNLEAGVRYLRWLGDRFAGDLVLILAGYNAGEGAVQRYDGVPPFRETREYIRRIYALLGLDPAGK